MELLTVCA